MWGSGPNLALKTGGLGSWAVWLLASHLTSPSLSFPICKVGGRAHVSIYFTDCP